MRLTNGEIEANGALIARAILEHPLAASATAADRAVALAVARREPQCVSLAERRALRSALDATAEAEFAAAAA